MSAGGKRRRRIVVQQQHRRDRCVVVWPPALGTALLLLGERSGESAHGVVELEHQVGAVGEPLLVLPRVVLRGVALPPHQVLAAAAIQARVDDLLDFVFTL